MQASTRPAEASELAAARCAEHPECEAVAICKRCGDFHCAECRKLLAGQAICARCRALRGVDYLDETRERFWGKRDAFVWYFGLFGSLSLLVTLRVALQSGDYVHVAITQAWLVVLIAYFARVRAMRLGLILLSVLDSCVDVVLVALGIPITPGKQTGLFSGPSGIALAFALNAFGILLATGAYLSPRNKLAFKIAVDDDALQRVYRRYVSNPLAMRSAVFGALALFLPLASVVTLVMGIAGLQRADPDAWPPRDGRVLACIGIGLSIMGILVWSFFVVQFIKTP